MENLLASPADVKSIIEAVNLKTFTRFTYLTGRDQVWPFPFEEIPDGFKDLAALLDEQIWDHPDPDHEVIITEPPDVLPGDPSYAGDPTLYFERQPRPGEVDDVMLAIWRMRAKAKEQPERRSPAEEAADLAYWQARIAPKGTWGDYHLYEPQTPRQAKKSKRERHRGEGGLSPLGDSLKAMPEPVPELQVELPQLAPARDNVVDLPGVKKQKVKHILPPLDVLGIIQTGYRGQGILRTVYKVYARSCYQPINKCWGYAGKSTKKGRYYNQGILELADKETSSGRSERRHLKWIVDEGIFLFHKRGWEKEGCSIYELPCNIAQVKSWDRYVKSASGKRSCRRR